MIIAGDCNATCQHEGRIVGCGVPCSFAAEDSTELQDILRAHGLVALNTFGPAPGHTFKFGPRTSQLDYIFTRVAHADRDAKRDHGEQKLSDTFQVDEAEMRAYLQQIPMRKAVSSDSVPGVVYRICEQELAPVLCKLLRYMWNAEHIIFPRVWCVAELIFLPKPGKKTSEVKDWRPIGLQDAVAKSVMHLLVDRLKPHVQDWASSFPLYAYMPGRSTRQALQVVFAHCDAVRHLCQQEADTIHRRFEGWKPSELCGGIQVCLDLSSAFDRVPWHHIRTAFTQAQVPPDLAAIILGWLSCSEYQIHNGSHTSCIQVGRGVKQGCRGSPTIFLAFMTLICRRLNEKLGNRFCQEHLTQYADDTHSAWTFHSYEELRNCIWQLSVIMETLEEFGMSLNDDKAQILFTVRGNLRQKARGEFTTKVRDKLVFVIEGEQGTRHVPLVRSTVYLGAKISYDQFEAQTVAHRMQKANVRFWQLQKFFTSKRGLSVPQRIRMWMATIRPTLMYAADCCLVGPTLQRKLQTLTMKHFRAICSCPSHIYHISDNDLLAKYQVAGVSDWLKDAYARDACTNKVIGISTEVLARWHDKLRDTLQATQHKLTHVAREIQPHACPVCGVYFDSRKSVKLHMYQSHRPPKPSADSQSPEGMSVEPPKGMPPTDPQVPEVVSASTTQVQLDITTAGTPVDDAVSTPLNPAPEVQAPSQVVAHSIPSSDLSVVPAFQGEAGLVFDRSVHSRDGLPTCSGCGAKFRRWDILRKHINKGWCPVFAKHDAPALSALSDVKALAVQDHVPITQRSEVIQAIADRGLEGLRLVPGIFEEMQNRLYPRVAIVVWFESEGRAQPQRIPSSVLLFSSAQSCVMTMDVDRAGQIEEFFGGLENSGHQSQYQQTELPIDELMQIVRLLVRTSVRHEDAIQTLRLDTGLVWFVKTGDGTPDTTSIIPYLQAVAAKLHGRENTEMSDRPLREIMFMAILQKLLTKLDEVAKDQTVALRCQQAGWLTTEQKWVYQKWCKETRTLVQDKTKVPVLHHTLVTSIKNMLRMVDE
ncbi:unnamed protein product, partial [Symbiodinium sp. CCMP2592]